MISLSKGFGTSIEQTLVEIGPLSPLRQWCGPSLNPNHQGCFVPSLVGPVVLYKKIFKILLIFFVILLLSLRGKGCGPSLKQI